MLSTDMEKMKNVQGLADITQGTTNPFPARPTEYIQSVIASSAECAKAIPKNENTEPACMKIIADVEKLYAETQMYTFCWAATLGSSIDNPDLTMLITEAQTMYLVRGNRYQLFQEDYFVPLLLPHDDELQKLYGISADKVISGLMSLEYALSQGRMQGLNTIGEIFDRYADGKIPAPEDLPQEELDALQSAFIETFSVEHYDVARITEWPESFINEFTYEPGEAAWYEKGEFENWPIVALPIQSKPFIKLNGITYCFDYYSLMDNFYRVLQKAVTDRDPSYKQTWQTRQKEASEAMAAGLLSHLMPGCTYHSSNYYSPESKKGQLSENDLIIHFHDVLLIVEVKAGSFTFAPPITDWERHARAYKSLIEDADRQCARTRKYLTGFETDAPLLDCYGKEKARIDMSEITDIFELSITIDDINTFASKAERLCFLSLESGAISISVNDLMVYDDYFESPFQFLHYLKQRRAASHRRSMVFNDELDHLGMYIEDNVYAAGLKDSESCDLVFVVGLRDDLDKYYSQGHQHQLDIEKPKQAAIPEYYLSILTSSAVAEMNNPVQFTSFILDFSGDTRSMFSKQIGRLLKLAKERGRTQILNTKAEKSDELSLGMSCFIEPSGADPETDSKYYRDYTLSMMLANREQDRHMVVLSFDSQDKLKSIVYEHLNPDRVSPEEHEYLFDLGVQREDCLIGSLKTPHRKIGRNELCPCGSGQKYKNAMGTVAIFRTKKISDEQTVHILPHLFLPPALASRPRSPCILCT